MAGRSERLFVSTGRGLEEALEGELRALGWAFQQVDGGYDVEGPPGAHMDACLHLRTANGVLLRLGRFEVKDPFALGANLRKVEVRSFVPGGGQIDAVVKRSPLRTQQIVNEAAKAWGQSDAGPRILVRVEGQWAQVSLDCAGELLHRRGYRQEVSRAPMRETLAAGILLLLGYDGGEPLWDPMCGSGTFPIEGAFIAERRAPGLHRRFDFERWATFDAHAWDDRRRAAEAKMRKAPMPILGSDLHAGSLGVARRNARRADVLDVVKLDRRDARELSPPEGVPPGLVVANLPYGKRVGELDELVPLHRDFGEVLKRRFEGWRVALLVGSERLADATGLVPEKVLWVDNGGLRCPVLVAWV